MPVIDLLQFGPHDTSWMILMVAGEIDDSLYDHYITNMRAYSFHIGYVLQLVI